MKRNILKSLTAVPAGAIAGMLLITGTASAASPPIPTEATVGIDGTLSVRGDCQVDSLVIVKQQVVGVGAATGSAMANCDKPDGLFTVTVSSGSGVAFVPFVTIDVTTRDEGQSITTKLMPKPEL
jgi:hypothetical protein